MISRIHSPAGIARILIVAAFGLLVMVPKLSAQENSYAEKLGFKSDDVVLIMHVEDMGMSLGANKGVIDSLERGIANSVAMMVPTPWAAHSAYYVKEHPGVDMGLQLTLNSEFDFCRWFPVAGSTVPSLMDPDGFFWRSVPLLLTNASPEQVEIELRAQIQFGEKLKLGITHLDSHLNALFRRKELFERYLKVAADKQIPMVIAGGHMTNAKVEDPALAEVMKEFSAKVWAAGLPVIDDMIDKSDEWEPAQKRQKLQGLLYRIKPGITQMNFRPAVPSDETRFFIRNDRSRSADSVALTDAEARRVIDNRGIILTTWRELMNRRKKSTTGPL